MITASQLKQNRLVNLDQELGEIEARIVAADAQGNREITMLLSSNLQQPMLDALHRAGYTTLITSFVHAQGGYSAHIEISWE